MPAVNAIRSLKVQPWVRGEQEVVLSGLGDANGLAFARNVNVHPDGRVERGNVPYSASGGGTGVGAFQIWASDELHTSKQHRHVVAVDAGNLYHYFPSQGTLQKQTPPWANGLPYGIAEAEGYVYITNRDNGFPYRLDKSTGGVAARTPSDFDGSSSVFPQASHLAYHSALMFAGNIEFATSGVEHRSRLHWSNVNDVETWDAADFIDFDPDDGQQITGLTVFGEDILVFKDQKMFLLTGRSEASFTVYKLTSEYGTREPRSICMRDGKVYFWDFMHGMVEFDGQGFVVITDPIDEQLRADAVFLNYDYPAGWVGDYLYIAFTEAKCLAWHRDSKAFTFHSFGFADMVAVSDEQAMLVGVLDGFGAREIEGVSYLDIPFGFKFPEQYEEATFTAYSWQNPVNGAMFRTPWYVFTDAAQLGRLRRLVTHWRQPRSVNEDAADIRIKVYLDGSGTAFREYSFSVDHEDGYALNDPFKLYSDVVDNFSDVKFRSIAFEVEFETRTSPSTMDRPEQFLGMALTVSLGGRQRGDIVPPDETNGGGGG